MQLIEMAILATILTTGAGGGVVPAAAGSAVLGSAVGATGAGSPGGATGTGAWVRAGSRTGVRPVIDKPSVGASEAGTTYRAPLPALRVLTAFTPPPDRYGPGHLGVDLAATAGAVVSAASSGVVGFAGPVAGRGVVVIVHPDGIRTEYEPLAVVVVTGQRVVAGQRLGSVTGTHRGCAPATCLHWGARRGTAYLDPLSLLAPLGAVRLLPW